MVRVDRLASVLRSEISSILSKKINDSRIGFISITEIKISKDMTQAQVYYSQFGSEEDKLKTKKGLQSASPFIQSELFKVINIQIIPKIHFQFDPSIERGVDLVNKINEL
ncbi:30S ribosome-binding factor RbfA [Candidatus Marinamargulisbacteria bacterium SCGC AAA071-K20]|nr:30S ribosome-binding factor RbfA [Candidatus Marinamargulisbacteria bacterium SCGC AAA071-K20]